MKRRHFAILSSVLAAALSATVAPTVAQVRYFEKPPSVDELRASLKRAAPTHRTRSMSFDKGPRGRSIEWDTGKSPAGPATTDTPIAAARPSAGPQAAAGAGNGAMEAPAVAVPVQFELGSSSVRSDSMPFIRSIADLLQQDKALQLVIEGHTDSSGGYRTNMVLSWDRALSVYKVLVERFGIDPSRLRPIGLGPTQPLQDVAPRDPINRRVQFRAAG